jgi:hypothetical protein
MKRSLNSKIKKLISKTRLVKAIPEEDCEGMCTGSVLGQSCLGGDLVNSDGYAPGDNRIPKTWKKKFRRGGLEYDEDAEEITVWPFSGTSTPILRDLIHYFILRGHKEVIDWSLEQDTQSQYDYLYNAYKKDIHYQLKFKKK